MIFPISDDDRHLLKPAWVTVLILVVNVVLYFYQTTSDAFTLGWSAVPWEITHGKDLVGNIPVKGGQIALAESPLPVYITLLSSMFMHGGLMHLGGNMLYLWIFGDNLEHRFGAFRFLFFYLVSGLVGTAAHIAMAPDSVVPMLGASGAISGILGAYIVLFPWNKVNAIFFYRIVTLPAILVIGVWAGMQLLGGWGTLARTGESGGVAYAAHIGGFVAGAVAGLFSRMRMKSEPESVFKQQSVMDPSSRRIW